MNRKKEKMEQPKKDGTAVPGFTPELGMRISQVIKQLGGLGRASQYAGVTDESLAAWRDGKTEARFLGIVGIAYAAGVSLDWLATGKENTNIPGAEPDAEKVNHLTGVSIDCELLRDVITGIEKKLGSQNRYLTPAKKALLISEVYSLVSERERAKSPQSDVDRLVVGMLKVVE